MRTKRLLISAVLGLSLTLVLFSTLATSPTPADAATNAGSSKGRPVAPAAPAAESK